MNSDTNTQQKSLSTELYKFISEGNSDARDEFVAEFKSDLASLSTVLSNAFILIENSDCANDPSDRASMVTTYLNLAIESALTAVHLLSFGHIAAAGNSMRISYESICMAALLKKEVKIQVINGNHLFNFYDEFSKKSSKARADRALNLVIKNSSAFGLNADGVAFLKAIKSFYNGYSHAGYMFIHSKIKLSSRQIYIGGGYESERKDLFEKHIKFIIRYSNTLNGWIKAVAYNAI